MLVYLWDGSVQTIVRAATLRQKLQIKNFYLIQSHYTDTGPTSPGADPITPGAWQGSHWSANLYVIGMTRSGKLPAQAGIEPRVRLSRGRCLNYQPVEAVPAEDVCMTRCAPGGAGPKETGSPPALVSLELNRRPLFPV